ncbi:hypothetical protein [Chitinimonas koreensis]|uniref:hypothetical protein n=1 Tax=Chitinimonas koreensis TaxID=356302 RepID=UPI00040C6264|nr:hypothetical protein [Chitinimonas koreensis]QNM98715.1 hypothetical protein H9L41_11130 [Chitinimonas koreensis]
MSPESDPRYKFFDPAKVLEDLHGDTAGFHRLAAAYLADLDPLLHSLAAGDARTPDIVHRLRTAFGIFHATRGNLLARHIEQTCRSGLPPPNAERRALLTEMIGLGEELRSYLDGRALG